MPLKRVRTKTGAEVNVGTSYTADDLEELEESAYRPDGRPRPISLPKPRMSVARAVARKKAGAKASARKPSGGESATTSQEDSK